jgi:hypothetical protein
MRRKGRFKPLNKADPISVERMRTAERIREAGERAKAEADARRAAESPHPLHPKEIGGANGPEPTRYGDWERKGVASDF